MKRIILGGMFLVVVLFFLVKLSSREPEITPVVPSGGTIICFGDSLTYGTGASPGMDYPSQLARMTGKEVINAGVPGNTTADALLRLEEDVLSRSPGIVLITLGGNDLKNKVPREVAFANLERIITSIQNVGSLVIVGSIEIPFYDRGFAKAYEEVCERTGAVHVENIYEGIMGKSEYMSDPIHPNDAGYTVIAQRFYTAMKPYL